MAAVLARRKQSCLPLHLQVQKKKTRAHNSNLQPELEVLMSKKITRTIFWSGRSYTGYLTILRDFLMKLATLFGNIYCLIQDMAQIATRLTLVNVYPPASNLDDANLQMYADELAVLVCERRVRIRSSCAAYTDEGFWRRGRGI